MCGVVGIWARSKRPVDSRVVDHFTDALAHRGPDGRGTYIDTEGIVALGHRRLAILDLTEAGHQPMSYGGGRYWITFNGEIYNYLELRRELSAKGHTFRSNSDTEVLLAAFAEWGPACQFRLNGMWAFAVWDAVKRELFVSRDRFGVKPLFYFSRGVDFYFASELKAFMALPPAVRPEFDEGVVAAQSNIESAKRTLLRDVLNLNAGHQLVLRSSGPPQVTRWWSTWEHTRRLDGPYASQVEEFRELFVDSCRLRMRSDVPLGTALSGGLDSSSILCTVADLRDDRARALGSGKEPYSAFFLDYAGTAHSELHEATSVSDSARVPMHTETMPLEAVSGQEIVDATFALESLHDPALGPWRVYRNMRSAGVFVSIDGHGADESLAGYHHYPIAQMNAALVPWRRDDFDKARAVYEGLFEGGSPEGVEFLDRLNRRALLRSRVKRVQRGMNARATALAVDALGSRDSRARRALRFLRDSSGEAVTGRSTQRWVLEASRDLERMDRARLPSASFESLTRHLYADFHYDILPTILAKFDRLSMAHGVEIRSPFLDWRLATFAFSLPPSSILRDGFTKAILRDAMNGTVPDSTRLRKGKIGFASPMVEWYRTSLHEFVLDSVNSRDFLASTIWNGPVIRDEVEDDFARGDYARAVRSWPFVQAATLMNSFRDYAASFPSA